MKFGALTIDQIEAFLERAKGSHRREFLDHLARCTRLAASLEAFLPPEPDMPAWMQEGDALARRIAALITRLTEERDQALAGMHGGG